MDFDEPIDQNGSHLLVDVRLVLHVARLWKEFEFLLPERKVDLLGVLRAGVRIRKCFPVTLRQQ
jgi:hypothetical protein